MIISNKHGICELPHQLPNDFRFTTSLNWEIRRGSENMKTLSLVLYLAAKIKILSILAKNSSKIEIELFS